MRRPGRDFEIFSVAALDLFASALGAFILIALLIFPYYKQQVRAEAQVQQVERELETARVEADNKRREATEAVIRAARAKIDAGEIRDELGRLEAAEAANTEARLKLAALEKEADKRVPFALLGLPVKAQSLLLVVDMSSSMKEFVPQAMRTLARILEPLDGDSRVGIIGYQSLSEPVFHFWPSEGGYRSMNVTNKRAAMDFSRSLEHRFGGSTPTREALIKALEHPAETIILLSDGAPDLYSYDRLDEIRRIVQEVTDLNRGRKEMHSVAIGDYVGDELLVTFLTELAIKNKGNFVGVAR